MTNTDPVTGAEFLARSLAANGTTHVFFIDAVLRRTLIELGTLGVQRVLGHSEKAVAYMADGYARIAGRPGICFAQSVGAANLAAGPAGRVSRPHPGDRDDRPQAAVDAAPQRISGNPAHAAVRAGHEILRPGGSGRRPAATDAAGMAGGDDRHPAAGASGPERPAGRGDRDRHGRRGAGRRTGVPADHAAAPSGRLRDRDRTRRRTDPAGEEGRHRRRRRGNGVRRRQGTAGAGRAAGRADRDIAGRTRPDPDPASPVNWLRRQLCRAAGQPDRA